MEKHLSRARERIFSDVNEINYLTDRSGRCRCSRALRYGAPSVYNYTIDCLTIPFSYCSSARAANARGHIAPFIFVSRPRDRESTVPLSPPCSRARSITYPRIINYASDARCQLPLMSEHRIHGQRRYRVKKQADPTV